MLIQVSPTELNETFFLMYKMTLNRHVQNDRDLRPYLPLNTIAVMSEDSQSNQLSSSVKPFNNPAGLNNSHPYLISHTSILWNQNDSCVCFLFIRICLILADLCIFLLRINTLPATLFPKSHKKLSKILTNHLKSICPSSSKQVRTKIINSLGNHLLEQGPPSYSYQCHAT